MKLVIYTQVYENYAWNEDGSIGKGDNAYWKAKGGDEYVVRDVLPSAAIATVMAVREQIEKASDYITETIADWELVDDDYLTQYERDQLEYEGRIVYPAKELEWA